jgi:hypothetical protein
MLYVFVLLVAVDVIVVLKFFLRGASTPHFISKEGEVIRKVTESVII